MRHLTPLLFALLLALLPAVAMATPTIVVTATNSTATNGTDFAWVSALYTFDSSYPTGGEVLTAAVIETAIQAAGFTYGQCNTLKRVHPGNGNITTTPYSIIWDDATGKMMAFVQSTGAQVSSEANMAALAVELFLICSL